MKIKGHIALTWKCLCLMAMQDRRHGGHSGVRPLNFLCSPQILLCPEKNLLEYTIKTKILPQKCILPPKPGYGPVATASVQWLMWLLISSPVCIFFVLRCDLLGKLHGQIGLYSFCHNSAHKTNSKTALFRSDVARSRPLTEQQSHAPPVGLETDTHYLSPSGNPAKNQEEAEFHVLHLHNLAWSLQNHWGRFRPSCYFCPSRVCIHAKWGLFAGV